MKSNFLTDIRTAVNVFGEIRKGRKEGHEIEVRRTVEVPCIQLGVGFLDTIEGCVLANCDDAIYRIASKTYRELPYEKKYQLAFQVEDGEYINRACLWKEVLKSVMTPKQCRVAMIAILHWYIHIKQMRQQESRKGN